MNPRKILIIRNDHIGDLVLSTAVFREIKKSFPDSRIALIANKVTRSLVEKNKNIDAIFELNTFEPKLKNFMEYFKMSQKIRKENFDLGIDLRGSLINSFFLLKLPGTKKRIAKTDLNPKITYLVTNPVDVEYKTHIVETNLKVINDGLDLNSENNFPEIITDKSDEVDVENFLRENEIKKFICLCPFAGLENKQWPLKNWENLVEWFGEYDKKRKVILIGTKKEEAALRILSSRNKNSLVVIDFNLRKMSLLFKKSDLVMTQDGGPMHIAWVSGAKLIELHNLFLKWLIKFVPLGKNSRTLYAKNIRMDSISVEEVKSEIKKILK